ncbi:MAG: hypothetical protein LUF92_02715, partial [Clostridiales bacterium]|nr:hypothetical protein [Clostridiales bacterium]
MAEQDMGKELSEEERLKQLAARMREAEYKGLSEEEIQERERQKELRRKKNIEILEDTLDILEKGCYTKDGQEIQLHYFPEQMREIQVFLPEEIAVLQEKAKREDSSKEKKDIGDGTQADHTGQCFFGCENIDALALAERNLQELKKDGE